MPVVSHRAPRPRWPEQERGSQERRWARRRPLPAGLGCSQEDKWVTLPWASPTPLPRRV